jgi:ATP-dependent Clp protease ATP-binding subunit ClpA
VIIIKFYILIVLNQSLHDKRVLSIDLSAIVAGSGIRGQFEEKFKSLLRDIEAEVIQLQLELKA